MNPFQDIFDAQKAFFATGVTRSYEWRVEQLDRMAGLLAENEAALQKAVAADFKTASQEYVFETAAPLGETQFQKSQLKGWVEPVEAPVPKFLAETGHKGFVYRDPYGVALIMGPFNGPLTLLIPPALTALAAGNTCILKLSEQLSATSALLMELVPRYFDPRAVTAVMGHREEVTELLKLPFDFIFFTGSTKVGKIVMKAAAENLTPVLLELGGQNPALVDETANIADAAKKIVWGAMAWGGQWCTSPGYAYVHEFRRRRFRRQGQEGGGRALREGPEDQSGLFAGGQRAGSLATGGANRPREGCLRRPVRPSGAIPRSDDRLSRHVGRSDHGRRGVRPDTTNPHLQNARRSSGPHRCNTASARWISSSAAIRRPSTGSSASSPTAAVR